MIHQKEKIAFQAKQVNLLLLSIVIAFVIPTFIHHDPLDPAVSVEHTITIKPSVNHSPISILNNSGLAAFPNKTGSGTPSQPYLIKDLVIDATGNSWGIYVYNTSLWLVIQNCTISNPNGKGFNLVICKNVTLRANTISTQLQGIHCIGGNNITITNNIVTSSTSYGINLAGGTNNTVSENTVSNCASSGIYLDNSVNNLIASNDLRSNLNGIECYYSNRNMIRGNIIRHNTFSVYLRDSNNCSVTENMEYENSGFYVYLQSSDYSKIWNNAFLNNRNYFTEGTGVGNKWDNGTTGNYYSNYQEIYPSATNDGRIWSIPYAVRVYEFTTDYSNDTKPLVRAPGNLNPVLDPLSDIICTIGIGRVITLNINDDNKAWMDGVNKPICWLTMSGGLLPDPQKYYFYVGGQPIQHQLSVFLPGVYTLTITVHDSLGGYTSDEITITVTWDLIWVAIAAVVTIAIIASVRKRSRKSISG